MANRSFVAEASLATPEDVTTYLAAAFETSDALFITQAIGTVARIRGMSLIAEQAGLSRENLYRALNGRTKPTLDTIVRVLDALGLQLTTKPKVRPVTPTIAGHWYSALTSGLRKMRFRKSS